MVILQGARPFSESSEYVGNDSGPQHHPGADPEDNHRGIDPERIVAIMHGAGDTPDDFVSNEILQEAGIAGDQDREPPEGEHQKEGDTR